MRKTQNHLLGSLCAAMLILVGTGSNLLAQAPLPPPGSTLLLDSDQGQGLTNVGSFTLTATYIANLVTFTDRALFMSAQAPTGYVGVLAVNNGIGGGYLVDYDGHIRAAYTNTPAGVFGASFVEFGPDGNAYVSYGGPSGTAVVKKYSFFGADLGTFTSGYSFANPQQFQFNGAYMYLIDYGNSKVVRYNAATGVYDASWGGISGVNGATTLAFMPGSTNDVLVAKDSGAEAERYHLTPTGATDLGIFANFGAHGANANQFAFGPDGNLYGNDTSAHQSILVFDGTTGNYIASYNSTAAGYSRGRGLAFIIPEPATFSLMGLGFLGLFLSRRNRRRS